MLVESFYVLRERVAFRANEVTKYQHMKTRFEQFGLEFQQS